jgi:hypothetical protein
MNSLLFKLLKRIFSTASVVCGAFENDSERYLVNEISKTIEPTRKCTSSSSLEARKRPYSIPLSANLNVKINVEKALEETATKRNIYDEIIAHT